MVAAELPLFDEPDELDEEPDDVLLEPLEDAPDELALEPVEVLVLVLEVVPLAVDFVVEAVLGVELGVLAAVALAEGVAAVPVLPVAPPEVVAPLVLPAAKVEVLELALARPAL